MTERNVGRPWTAHEDRLLTDAVHRFGENDNWKIIAETVPGRTNKACRKRWLHSLSPSVKKTAWTPDEDQRLLQLYAAFGPKWSAIARQIPGRTDDACSKRYREALDPSLKKDEWTVEEDEKLLEVYARLGGKWGQVGQELGRSGLGCRNRWRLLERKRANAAKDTLSPLPIIQQTPAELPPADDVPLQSGGWYPRELGPAYWTPFYEDCSIITSPDMPTDSLMVHVSPIVLSEQALPPIQPQEPVPPFQFSSSSLSAALSAHLATQPLPPIDLNTAASPASPAIEDDQFQDILMSDTIISNPTPLTSPQHYSGSSLAEAMSSCSSYELLPGTSPERRTSELDGALFELPSKSFRLPVPFNNSADDTSGGSSGSQEHLPTRFRMTATNGYLRSPYFSSNSSSPIGLASLSLSPTNSPPVSQPLSLPSARHTPSSDSALFAPYSRPQPKTKPSNKKKVDTGPHRLSSSLAATSDPNILPYACGHDHCWPRGAVTSVSRFATSGELSDHFKQDHTESMGGDKPYRCALEGCGKSWKNINGLQYHLQISTAHFRHAITSTISTQALSEKDTAESAHDEGHDNTTATEPPDPLATTSTNQRGMKESRKAKKHYACTVPQCYKVYRQLSGLRYHLMHGHPREMPAQLDIIPPTLARQVDQKLRSKDASVNASPAQAPRGLPPS